MLFYCFYQFTFENRCNSNLCWPWGSKHNNISQNTMWYFRLWKRRDNTWLDRIQVGSNSSMLFPVSIAYYSRQLLSFFQLSLNETTLARMPQRLRSLPVPLLLTWHGRHCCFRQKPLTLLATAISAEEMPSTCHSHCYCLWHFRPSSCYEEYFQLRWNRSFMCYESVIIHHWSVLLSNWM